MLREIEIQTDETPDGTFYAHVASDTHNDVFPTHRYWCEGSTRSEAFMRCKEYMQGSRISLVGRSAAWWHINGESGKQEPLSD